MTSIQPTSPPSAATWMIGRHKGRGSSWNPNLASHCAGRQQLPDTFKPTLSGLWKVTFKLQIKNKIVGFLGGGMGVQLQRADNSGLIPWQMRIMKKM